MLKAATALWLLALGFFALGLRSEPLRMNLKTMRHAFVDYERLRAAAPLAFLPAEAELAAEEDTTQARDSIATDSSQTTQAKTTSRRGDYDPAADTAHYKERVLLIGDSQLEKLRLPIYNYCEANGSKLLASVIWYGSTTTQWAQSDTLQYYIRNYRPTVVLFAIGLNELFVRNLDERRTHIQQLLQVFQQHRLKYCWLGPAAWTQDKGIVATMQQTVPATNFYDASKLKITRAADGHHPSPEGGKIWADSVALFATRNNIIDFSQPIKEMRKLRNTKTILISNRKR